MAAKHTPERMCVACRCLFPKKDLIRVVKNRAGKVLIDDSGKAEGRGAYICRNAECLAAAKKNKAFSRSFRENINGELYEKLRIVISGEER